MFTTRNKLGITASATGGRKLVSQVVANRPPSLGTHRSREQAFLPMGGNNASNSVTMFSGGNNASRADRLLDGLIPADTESALHRYYRDIYHYDPIPGSTVDLMSTLPFSDYDLVGLPDDKLASFISSTERLNLKSLFPELSVEYLVDGKFVGTLLYRHNDKLFTDIIPHDVANVTIQEVPMYGLDPSIRVTNDKRIKDFMASTDDYLAKIRSKLNPNLLKAMQSESYTLDPLTTLYLPRKTFPRSTGTSFFKRLLPIYLLEKILYRGTLVEAGKRQRSILHVQGGDDNWEPTPEELNALVALFQQADLDPLGAIIATRQSIATSEIRQGGEFWKWTDITDATSGMKLRALGVSESFLSGDATFATAEANLSVFIESLKSYRNMVTHKVFTNRIFPTIAVVNGYYRDGNTASTSSKLDLQVLMNDASKLLIPEVRWHKSLNPSNDRDTMETLTALEEKGVPITLRMWCAAGNVDLDSLLIQQEEDLKLKARIKTLLSSSQDVGNEEGNEETSSSLFTALSNYKRKPESWLSRDLGDTEIVGTTKTGAKKSIPNQRAANAKANAAISSAMTRLSDPHHYNEVAKTAKTRLQQFYGATK